MICCSGILLCAGYCGPNVSASAKEVYCFEAKHQSLHRIGNRLCCLRRNVVLHLQGMCQEFSSKSSPMACLPDIKGAKGKLCAFLQV